MPAGAPRQPTRRPSALIGTNGSVARPGALADRARPGWRCTSGRTRDRLVGARQARIGPVAGLLELTQLAARPERRQPPAAPQHGADRAAPTRRRRRPTPAPRLCVASAASSASGAAAADSVEAARRDRRAAVQPPRRERAGRRVRRRASTASPASPSSPSCRLTARTPPRLLSHRAPRRGVQAAPGSGSDMLARSDAGERRSSACTCSSVRVLNAPSGSRRAPRRGSTALRTSARSET